MSKVRTVATFGLAAIAMVAVVGCSAVRGPADRTDEFVAAGQDCSGSWWLGDVRAGAADEARVLAEQALADAKVTPSALAAATSLLDLSRNDAERHSASAVDFESEAYMLAVTLHVKDALDAAGYPDSARVIEVFSERRCS